MRSEFDCVCVPAGTDIFHRGDPGTCAYLIEEGEVRIWVPDEGGPRELALLGAAEIFGEMAIMDGGAALGHRYRHGRLPAVRNQPRKPRAPPHRLGPRAADAPQRAADAPPLDASACRKRLDDGRRDVAREGAGAARNAARTRDRARHRRRRIRAAFPADRRARRRRDRRLRGAGALEPSRARPAAALRLHSGRGDEQARLRHHPPLPRRGHRGHAGADRGDRHAAEAAGRTDVPDRQRLRPRPHRPQLLRLPGGALAPPAAARRAPQDRDHRDRR